MNCYLCGAIGTAQAVSHEVPIHRGASVFFVREIYSECDDCGMKYISPEQDEVNRAALDAPHPPPPPDDDE